MRKAVGVSLIVLAVFLYAVGLYGLAAELRFSLRGLWLTLTDGHLFASFLALAVGALGPAALLHYVGPRLLRSATSARTS